MNFTNFTNSNTEYQKEYPGQRLSLQRHKKREEHWFIHRGCAVVTLNEVEYNLKP